MEYDESVLVKRKDDVKSATETGLEQHMTLHCVKCNTVLGDSFGVCGEVMDFILCLRVTDDVVVSDEMELGHEGEMDNCIYSFLKCNVCCCAVGKVIRSAPSRLAAVRSLFLLRKANISCYILNCSSMVKASKISFQVKLLRENVTEVKQEFKAQLDRMSQVKSRLANRNKTSDFVR